MPILAGRDPPPASNAGIGLAPQSIIVMAKFEGCNAPVEGALPACFTPL